jgi:hypothetical protein
VRPQQRAMLLQQPTPGRHHRTGTQDGKPVVGAPRMPQQGTAGRGRDRLAAGSDRGRGQLDQQPAGDRATSFSALRAQRTRQRPVDSVAEPASDRGQHLTAAPLRGLPLARVTHRLLQQMQVGQGCPAGEVVSSAPAEHERPARHHQARAGAEARWLAIAPAFVK